MAVRRPDRPPDRPALHHDGRDPHGRHRRPGRRAEATRCQRPEDRSPHRRHGRGHRQDDLRRGEQERAGQKASCSSVRCGRITSSMSPRRRTTCTRGSTRVLRTPWSCGPWPTGSGAGSAAAPSRHRQASPRMCRRRFGGAVVERHRGLLAQNPCVKLVVAGFGGGLGRGGEPGALCACAGRGTARMAAVLGLRPSGIHRRIWIVMVGAATANRASPTGAETVRAPGGPRRE